MDSIGGWLEKRGGTVRDIAEAATLEEAARAMHAHGVGSLLVRRGRELAGILTWHDLIRAMASPEADRSADRVGDLMSEDLRTIGPEAPFAEAEELMVRHRIRHLPVLRGGKAVGVLDLIDVLRHRLEEVAGLGEDLVAYITGSYPH